MPFNKTDVGEAHPRTDLLDETRTGFTKCISLTRLSSDRQQPHAWPAEAQGSRICPCERGHLGQLLSRCVGESTRICENHGTMKTRQAYGKRRARHRVNTPQHQRRGGDGRTRVADEDRRVGVIGLDQRCGDPGGDISLVDQTRQWIVRGCHRRLCVDQRQSTLIDKALQR